MPRKLPSKVAVITQGFVPIAIHLQFQLFSVPLEIARVAVKSSKETAMLQ